MKLEITEAQLTAFIEIVDEAEAMIGAAEDDSQRIKWIKMVDKMLAKNNITRIKNKKQ